ncbi:ATP-binding cassette domain-containing protein [Anaerococcus sp. NML200574]|uniref:ABC transporter ATP-binding protein n=1 Tax=Anaerococcus kampingae TaxID=3115614 RepID=A0ABW9MFJ5_9FIRM|nr:MULTISPECIES: ATP-binding cassette domain-containing protein [unclassified Anaerococcus]MCW6679003.1 ATP-binding cassette domain-containing protein [Anaerococcus sp. NML200574]
MIKIKNVTKKIDGQIVLDKINLTILDGKIYGFVGHNGSGKTMLFRAICGLIGVDEGIIEAYGKVVNSNNLLDKVGLLLENPSFIGDLSAIDNLKLIASINKVADEGDINNVLKKVSLYDQKDKNFEKFSLGMKQRLAIANVILEKPQILIFDEPTNAIDEQGIIALKEIIMENKKSNKIILLASHEEAFIDQLADVKILMKAGKIIDEYDL